MASERLDRTLTRRECIKMRMHYAICYLCRRYEDQLRVLHDGLAQHPDRFNDACGGAKLEDCEKERLKKLCSGK